MATATLDLSERAQAKIDAWLKEKWTNLCPMCSQNAWQAEPHITVFRWGLPGDLPTPQMGGPIFPCVPVVCGNCGNTAFLDAAAVGVV